MKNTLRSYALLALLALVLLSQTCCSVSASNSPRTVITTLPFGTTVEGAISGDDVAYLRTTIEVGANNVNTYLQYNYGSPDAKVCLYVGFNQLPTTEYYIDGGCTARGQDGDLTLPHHLAASGDWYAAITTEDTTQSRASSPLSGLIQYAVTAYNTSRSPTLSCPQITTPSTKVVAGAYDFDGFCWYLGNYGYSCDDVCAGLTDGHNFADLALYMLSTPTCAAGKPDDKEPISYFYLNGNPLRWVGSSGYQGVAHDITTGEGYYPGSGTNGRYYGHCTDGRQVGSQPGTPNTHSHRALVCPCFASDQRKLAQRRAMAAAAAAEARVKREALSAADESDLSLGTRFAGDV